MTVDVAIIGAGISGLAVACGLRRVGHRVLVLERQSRVGGKAISERIGGFLMEHGPSSLNGASAEVLRWSQELGLDGGRLELGKGVRRRYLTSGGTLYGIPTHPLGFLTSSYLSWRGRARLLAEFAAPAGSGVPFETVREFCCRRFGEEFADRVMDPLVRGLFAGDASKLAVASVFPALVAMEHQSTSILRGVIRSRLRGGTMPARRLFSWREGVGALPQALGAELEQGIKTGVAIRRIRRLPTGFELDAGPAGSLHAGAVVIATPAHVAAHLLDQVDAAAGAAAAAIEAPRLAVVFHGYERRQIEHPLDGIGYLTASGEGRTMSGALFCSTMFEGRAPDEHVALAAYAGGACSPALARLPGKELDEIVRAEFKDLLGARGQPVVTHHRVWSHGLPQYTVGHQGRITTLNGTEARTPGLFLTGNYLRGVSLASCLEQAADAAVRVDRFLSGATEASGIAA